MDRQEAQDYCLTKPGSWLDEPWDDTQVVKVGPKIFAFLGARNGTTIGLKCGRSREEADEWLADFPDDAVRMPYLWRSGWNSLTLGGAISDHDILGAIDASYEMVVQGLPKVHRPPLA